MIQSEKFHIDENFKLKALNWASNFDHYSFLNFNNLQIAYAGYSPFPSILAAGSSAYVEANTPVAFSEFQKFIKSNKGYNFGYFGYDLKNEIEELTSANPDLLEFPDLFFFKPLHLLHFSQNAVKIESKDPIGVFEEIQNYSILPNIIPQHVKVNQRISKEEYITKVKQIRNHIIEGDVYELNFCLEFYAEQVQISPEQVFQSLSTQNPMPFGVILKNKDKYLISASPERFLKKIDNKLTSQPMKGTSKRSSDPLEDQKYFNELKESEKERSENMMIVDLVRNDLAKSSKPGTTQVEELFGVYSLSKVHQMISTVSSELKPEVNFLDAIKNAFPMGSMTGAPKIKAMELIEQLEESKRGLYSGTFGYIDPDSNFDFNVVIRSINYNKSNGYLSFQAGSAITYDSIPEKEYEECLLKAESIKKLLEAGC
jgi:para-aminobenzoate synthetase component 1